ncbi:MAG TPA: YisL family protein [Staphylococcus sp.]|nr:YisL family protein [Staphylococcus sp.]
MLHMHIASWALLIILFFAAYFNFSEKQGATPYFKPIHMLLRLFMVLVLISGFWTWIQAISSGNAGGHMLLTLKMLGGVAVVALMEVSITKRKKGQPSHSLLWTTIIVIIITMLLGVILPWGPITQMFGF